MKILYTFSENQKRLLGVKNDPFPATTSLTLKWSYGVFRHPRGRKIAIIQKLLQIKIWNFLTFIIWLSSKNLCHYYFVGCHLWRHHGHQRGTGRRRNYNFLTVHSTKQDIHFFTFVKMCVLNPIYVFEVGEFNGDTFRTIPLPVYLENLVRTGSSGTSRLPNFLTCGILWLYLYLCFRGRGIQWWHFQNSTTTSWPRKSSLNRKYWNFEVTHLFLWWNFIILHIFMFSRWRNSMATLSEFYHHRLTSKI